MNIEYRDSVSSTETVDHVDQLVPRIDSHLVGRAGRIPGDDWIELGVLEVRLTDDRNRVRVGLQTIGMNIEHQNPIVTDFRYQ